MIVGAREVSPFPPGPRLDMEDNMNPVTDFPWTYKHVTADTQVRGGGGVLHTIVVNGLTTAGDATIYDSLVEGAPIICVLHLDLTTSVSVQPVTFTYDCKFSTGLYIGYDAVLVADLTVTYI